MACHLQVGTGHGGGGDHSYTKVVDSVLVPTSNEKGHRGAYPDQEQKPHITRYTEEAPDGKNDSSGSEVQLEGQLSVRAKELINEATRPSTKIKYQCIVNKWTTYCSKMGCSEVATTATFSIFLAIEFDRELKHTYLMQYKSVLRSFIKNVDMSVIKQILKGIHNKRPPKARYCAIWDVNLVLAYVGAMRTDSFIDMSRKTATLLMLLSGNRVNMLTNFRISNMTLTSLECTFVFSDVLKHSRENFKDRPMTFRPYPHDPSLCPVQTMIKYMEMRAPKSGYDEVFTISVRNHTPAHHDTIANWIKHILACAGVDTGTYAAHSCRSASTTAAALAGVSLTTIVNSASWSNVNTFKQYYFKEIKDHFDLFKPNFGHNLLENYTNSTSMYSVDDE